MFLYMQKKREVIDKRINIFYVGLPKCGSSWLYQICKENKLCGVAKPRDIHFFDFFFKRGINWYHQFYSFGDSLNIDICHDYIISEMALKRIALYNKNSIILYTYRNPVEFVFSLYEETKKFGFAYFEEHGYKKPKSLDEFLNSTLLIKFLNYKLHIDSIYKYFPKNQCVITSLEYIQDNQKGYIKKIFQKHKKFFDYDNLEFFIIKPSKSNLILNILGGLIGRISIFIRRKGGNYYLMQLINLKSFFNSRSRKSYHKNKKILLNENFKRFQKKYGSKIEIMFNNINGFGYEEFMESYCKSYKRFKK